MKKATSAADVQLAVRYGLRSPSRFDLDLMLLHWSHPLPAYALTDQFDKQLSEPPVLSLKNLISVHLMAGSLPSAVSSPKSYH
jgi:hypothetical protein